MTLVLRLIVNAVAIWLASTWVDGITVVGAGNDDYATTRKVLILLGVAVVFTVINALVKPLVKLLSLPLVILSLGLFTLVINALMLWLTAAITTSTDYGLHIDGFWAAFWGSIIIAVVNWVLGVFIPDRK